MSEQVNLERELKYNENCIIKKISLQLFLNQKEITKQKSEFLKILCSSQKVVGKIIKQQKELLRKTLQYLHYQPNTQKNQAENEEFQESDSDELRFDESSSESENCLQNFEQNLQTEMNKYDQVPRDKEGDGNFKTILEKINEDYDKLLINIFDDKDFELSVVSPFFIKQIRNDIYFNGTIKNMEALIKKYCKSCSTAFNWEIKQINQELRQQNIYLQFEKNILNLEQSVACRCKSRQFNIFKTSKFNCNFSNITYNNLFIEGSISIDANNESDQPSLEIPNKLNILHLKINQFQFFNLIIPNDTYFKAIYINFFKQNDLEQIFTKLQGIRNTEMCLIPSQGLSFKQARFILNSNSLIKVKKKLFIKKNIERYDLVNKKYSTLLSLFCSQKIFGDQFSFFRIMYDLHEQD